MQWESCIRVVSCGGQTSPGPHFNADKVFDYLAQRVFGVLWKWVKPLILAYSRHAQKDVASLRLSRIMSSQFLPNTRPRCFYMEDFHDFKQANAVLWWPSKRDGNSKVWKSRRGWRDAETWPRWGIEVFHCERGLLMLGVHVILALPESTSFSWHVAMSCLSLGCI